MKTKIKSNQSRWSDTEPSKSAIAGGRKVNHRSMVDKPHSADNNNYFTSKLTQLNKGCGKVIGNNEIACGDSVDERINIETGHTEYRIVRCKECWAKIQQLKEDEEEVRKAKEQMIMDFDNAFDAGYRNFSDVLFIVEKFSKELGIPQGALLLDGSRGLKSSKSTGDEK